MSDAWEEIQAIKSKRNSLREKLEKRKKERQDILSQSGSTLSLDANTSALSKIKPLVAETSASKSASPVPPHALAKEEAEETPDTIKPDPGIERLLLRCLCEASLTLPTTSRELADSVEKEVQTKSSLHETVVNLLQKFTTQQLICCKEAVKDGRTELEIISAEHNKLVAMVNEQGGEKATESVAEESSKRKAEGMFVPSCLCGSCKEAVKDGRTELEIVSAEHNKLVAMVNEQGGEKATESVAEESSKRKAEGMFVTSCLCGSCKEAVKDGRTELEIVSAEHNKLVAMVNEQGGEKATESVAEESSKRKAEGMFVTSCLCGSCKEAVKDGRTELEIVSAEHNKLVAMVNEQGGEKATESVAEESSKRKAEGMFVTSCLCGSCKEAVKDGRTELEIVSAEHNKLVAMVNEQGGEKATESVAEESSKRKAEGDADSEPPAKSSKSVGADKDEANARKLKDKKDPKATDIMSLLSMPTIREKENKKVGEEILDLLSKPTAKERSLAERFKSQGGAQVMEFCPLGTKTECSRVGATQPCKKLHFKKIIQMHTDESLGDCSFLNTCFHMDTCKYVHYEVDGQVQYPKDAESKTEVVSELKVRGQESTILYPQQWVQCDLRYLDMAVLGKFAVIMADPPWDIHMELPYGTMSDDEMRQLGIPTLQDDGLIFLWVTGRAMELGRECLKLWGYERVDEIIWVKTNQLQRIIRTGRTGHWLNHGKEHCLVGMKGSPDNLNRGLDCDVIVAEVRATSHKPDEIYGIIERLSPGTRKIELFGRPHNVQPNWITLGNQVDGVRLLDPKLIQAFRKRYPDGNCMTPSKA